MLSPDMTIHHFSRANYQVQTTLLAQIPSMKRRCSRCTVTEQLPENSLQLKSSTRVRIQSGSPNCFRPKLSTHYLKGSPEHGVNQSSNNTRGPRLSLTKTLYPLFNGVPQPGTLRQHRNNSAKFCAHRVSMLPSLYRNE